MEFGRLFHPFWAKVVIFAADIDCELKMKAKLLLTLPTLLFFLAHSAMAKDYSVASPNGRISVSVDENRTLAVTFDGKEVVSVETDMAIIKRYKQGSDATANSSFSLGRGYRYAGTRHVDDHVVAPFYRQASFQMSGNQMELRLAGGFGMQIRAYDEGVAYRFYTTDKKMTVVADETAD